MCMAMGVWKGKEESMLPRCCPVVASKNTAVADCRVQPKTSFTAEPSEHCCQHKVYIATEDTIYHAGIVHLIETDLVWLSKLILTMGSRPHIRRRIFLFWHISESRQALQGRTWSLEKNDKSMILILKSWSAPWNVLAKTYPVIPSRQWRGQGEGQAWPRRPWLGPTRPSSSWKKSVIIFELSK